MLPYRSPLPDDPAARRRVRAIRVAAYVAVIAAVIVTIIQFQYGTMRNLRKAEQFDRAYPDWPVVFEPGTPPRPGGHKGAIGRWRKAVRQFWAGRNIYGLVPKDWNSLEHTPVSQLESASEHGLVFMHPNTVFTVLLLTPFAYLPVWAMALSFNLLKAAALAAAVLMTARLAAHEQPDRGQRDPRIADWVLLLGLLWTLLPILTDLQHGNTNTFVLAAIVLHLWLYRRGRDIAAGAALAGAICLKLTPVLFVVYWLYQRSWKPAASAVAATVALAVVIPAAAVGPTRYAELTGSWYRSIIRPGLVERSWYPEHINQSLSGVVSRYFLEGRDGDIFWGPDDDPHYQTRRHGWITIVPLPPATARWLLRAGQLAVVLLGAWAIGLRKLPRRDGRRALHYGIVLLRMMLLNQRTWHHHAVVLLPAGVAVWQAVAYARISLRARAWALGLTVAAGVVNLLGREDLFRVIAKLTGHGKDAAERWTDVAKAYGPTFYLFVLLLAAAAVLAAATRRGETPYADRRQTLTRA